MRKRRIMIIIVILMKIIMLKTIMINNELNSKNKRNLRKITNTRIRKTTKSKWRIKLIIETNNISFKRIFLLCEFMSSSESLLVHCPSRIFCFRNSFSDDYVMLKMMKMLMMVVRKRMRICDYSNDVDYEIVIDMMWLFSSGYCYFHHYNHYCVCYRSQQ